MALTKKSEQLYEKLHRRITAMKDGETFLTVRQVMAEYQVSQSTVTPAVNHLKEKGLLKTHVGRGSFVSRPLPAQPLVLLLQYNWPSPVLPAMAAAMQEGLTRAGFRFRHMVYDHREDVTGFLAELEADLIVLDGIADDLLTAEQIVAITHSPAPVLLCRNTVTVKQINYICGDNHGAGASIANYFYRMGHRKLGILINEPHLHTTLGFWRGFESSARSNGCTVEVLDCGVRPGARGDERIKEFMEEYCHGKYDFTALFPISSNGAETVRRCLLQHGKRVPEDLSLASTCGAPDSEWLTVIDSGADVYRELVPRLVRDILERKEDMPRQIEFPQKLLEKHSVLRLQPMPEAATSRNREGILL